MRSNLVSAMRLFATALLAISALSARAATTPTETSPAITPKAKKQILSQVYTVEKKYKSMEGPSSMARVFLREEGDRDKAPELIWLTAVRTEMVGEDGKTPQLPELMCHVNLDIDSGKHGQLFGLSRGVPTRLVTLSQGMLSAKFPEGFGFPVASNEPLVLFTQVLNHNIPNPKGIKVRHRVTFEYVRDRDLKTPMKPLMNIGASGMVLLNENPLALPVMPGIDAATGEHGASCLLLPRAPNAAGTASDYVDPQGRKLTGHWVVPPGKQVNHSDITWFMNLPYDTKLHYAAVHLHPFAKSLTVRDVTTNTDVFTATAKGPKKGVGLMHVDTFVSRPGVQLYKDHKYELISVYDNPTQDNHDSMASVFLGLEDPEFIKPDPVTLAIRAQELFEMTNDSGVILRTTAGDFAVSLFFDQAPQTAKQFVRAARAGVLNHAWATRLETTPASVTFGRTVSAEQAQLIGPAAQEVGVRHEPGVLSYCAGEQKLGEYSFSILMSAAPGRDGRCIAFGKVGPGAASVREIASAPRNGDGQPHATIEITKAEVIDLGTGLGDVTLAPPRPIASLK